jgi:uncharacterized oxidoreductase
MPNFTAAQLTEIAERILCRIPHTRGEDARVVAEHLTSAHLAGHDSHGIIRIPQYHQHAREGRLNAAATVEIERETPGTALLNGNWTWGQVTAKQAMDIAIEKARHHHIAAVGARQCYHVGRVGSFALLAAGRGFIARIWCNGHGIVRVAPWGGAEARLATNPVAIAVPTGGRPILVDITTSVVAEGKIRVAKNKGEKVPDGWLLDKDGAPTNDPAALYDGGTLLPFGGPVGYKGFGLGMVVDLLGGALTGAGCGVMSKEKIGNGLLVEVVDPAAFVERDVFLRRVDDYVAYLRSAKAAPGVKEILMPGEPEFRMEDQRRRDGISVDDETWRQVCETAAALGATL